MEHTREESNRVDDSKIYLSMLMIEWKVKLLYRVEIMVMIRKRGYVMTL